MAVFTKQNSDWDWCHYCGKRTDLNVEVNFADDAEHSIYPPNRFTRVCGPCGLEIARVALTGVAEKRPATRTRKWTVARPNRPRTAEEAAFASSAVDEIDRIGSELAELESDPRRRLVAIQSLLAEMRAEVEDIRDDRRGRTISEAIVKEAARRGVPAHFHGIVAHGVDRALIDLGDESTPHTTILRGVPEAVAAYLDAFPTLAPSGEPGGR